MSELPITAPPIVDFSQPYSELRALSAQRNYLRSVAQDITRASVDIQKFDAEAAKYANYATTWAVTLFFADLLRNSISAADRRAPILFRAIDNYISNANKYLKIFGLRKFPTKRDVLNTVDPNLQSPSKFFEGVRVVRDELKKQKLTLPKPYQVLLDIALDMADDSILIIQAGQTAQQSRDSTASAQASVRSSLARVQRRMMAIDAEITRLIETAERRQNIA